MSHINQVIVTKERRPSLLGWIEIYDTKSQRYYYHNPVTNEISWTHPKLRYNTVSPTTSPISTPRTPNTRPNTPQTPQTPQTPKDENNSMDNITQSFNRRPRAPNVILQTTPKSNSNTFSTTSPLNQSNNISKENKNSDKSTTSNQQIEEQRDLKSSVNFQLKKQRKAIMLEQLIMEMRQYEKMNNL